MHSEMHGGPLFRLICKIKFIDKLSLTLAGKAIILNADNQFTSILE
jgi:hypothetical protein